MTIRGNPAEQQPTQRSSSLTATSSRPRNAYLDLDQPRALPYNDGDSRQEERRRIDLLSEALVAKGATSQSRLSRPPAPEISIRGAAGPYLVEASNFASGTTAADIESAMVPSGHDMLGCSIVSTSPTVVAEMLFIEKSTAEKVIDTFNGKKADGRILSLRMKVGNTLSKTVEPDVRVNGSAVEDRRKPVENSYETQRERLDRVRRTTDSAIQQEARGLDDMDVDPPKVPTAPRSHDRPTRRRDDDDRGFRRDDRYDGRDSPPRGPRHDRRWEGARSDRPFYNDGYSRQRGYR